MRRQRWIPVATLPKEECVEVIVKRENYAVAQGHYLSKDYAARIGLGAGGFYFFLGECNVVPLRADWWIYMPKEPTE